MPLSDPQKQIAESNKRFRVAICGRRFGKTYLSIRELAKYARFPRSRCWYIAPTRAQGKGIVWEELKDKLSRLNWIDKINESELKLKLVNGSEIQIMSADAYERTRGYSVDFIVFDEFADMNPDVWTATRPALSDREGSAFFIGTPKGTYNWSKDIYDMSKENDDWQSFSFTTLDGGRVTVEELESAKRDMDERLYRQEFLATFEDAGSKVYYAFSEQNINKYEGPQPNSLIVGCDFNVTPITAAIGVRTDNDTVHFIDEILMHGSNTDELAQEIRNRYPWIRTDRITVFPDPAGAQRKTSAGGRTDISILQNAGFTVKAPRSHAPVRDGNNSVNARLCSADGAKHMFVDPKCKHIIESLERHSYKEGTQVPDKESGYDHMADAIRYLVHYLWPIRTVTETREEKRWLHRIA